MGINIADALLNATESVTKAHTTQVKREERDKRAAYSRSQSYIRKIPKKEILFDVLEEAYAHASDNGRLPAIQRQVFYAARKLWKQKYPDMEMDYNTFTNYLAEYTHDCSKDWRIIKDPRGKLIEPHTELTVPLGTIEVDKYLDNSYAGQAKTLADSITVTTDYPTTGHTNRFSALLYIEKEGFNTILEDAGIPQKYDIAIASSKGQSVVAMRKLVDEFCGPDGVPLLVVHDFDKDGFSIADNLVSDTMRYEFENEITHVDLGLRLTDVEEYGLDSEPCNFRGHSVSGATDAEAEFLRSGQRVELNAMTSPQFVEWIEAKLQEHGIKKVVPDEDTLAHAYRRAFVRGKLQKVIDDATENFVDQADDLDIPADLAETIRQQLDKRPRMPWDKVVAEIASEIE